MAGTKVATAYVQILPTTKDIKSNLSKALSEVVDSGSDYGEKLGKNIGSSAKSALIAAGIGTAIGSIIKSAISNTAEYEQLAGGVEKIFDGMDTAKIVKDAQEAYKTLGMSANDYMRTINDVGATFASTMGASAGYENAKRGLQAISDYASGTGKSVDLLGQKFTMITRSTSSYQSIADQFSGILPATSAAFLQEAQSVGVLADSYTSLSQVPISEYQSAVTAMLERGVSALNLTGNTAREASTTVSGSIQMMQASWQNLLTTVASSEMDLQTAVSNFVDSVEAVVNNLSPIIVSIGPQLTSAFTQIIAEMIPVVGEMFVNLIVDMFKQIPNIIANMNPLSALVMAFVTAFATIKAAASLNTAITSVKALMTSFAQIAPVIASKMGIMSADTATTIANATATGALATAEGVDTTAKIADTAATQMATIASAELMAAQLACAGAIIVTIGEFALMIGAIATAVSAVSVLIEESEKLARTFVENNNMTDLLKAGLTGLKDIVSAILSPIKSLADTILQTANMMRESAERVAQACERIADAIDALSGNVRTSANNIATSITNMGASNNASLQNQAKMMQTNGANLSTGLYNGWTKSWSKTSTNMIKDVESTMKTIKEKSLQEHSPSRLTEEMGMYAAQGLGIGFVDEMKNTTKTMLGASDQMVSSIRTSVADVPNSTNVIADKINTALQNITVNADIQIEPDATRLFKVVKKQASVYRKATGKGAFA